MDSGREVSITRIGYHLALLLFAYIAVVSGVLLFDYLAHSPSVPSAQAIDATKLEYYQQLSELYTERTLKLYDHLVVKSFLPVFTAVLGYIFGTRGIEKEDA